MAKLWDYIKSYVLWAALAVAVIFVAVAVICSDTEDMRLTADNMITINSDWTVEYDDGDRVSADIPIVATQSRGDSFCSYTRRVNASEWGSTILLYSFDGSFEVLFDGKEYYSFGMEDDRPFGLSPGVAWHLIQIPKYGISGMRVNVYSDVVGADTVIKYVYLGDRGDCILQIMRNSLLYVVLFILSLAFLCFVTFAVLLKWRNDMPIGSERYAIPLMMVITLSIVCHTDLTQVLFGNQYAQHLVKCLCDALFPLLLLKRLEHRLRGSSPIIYQIMAIITGAYPFVMIGLTMLGVASCTEFYYISNSLLLLVQLYYVIRRLVSLHRKKPSTSEMLYVGIMTLDMVAVGITIGLNIVGYYFSERLVTILYLSILAILFEASCVVNISDIISAKERAEKELIARENKILTQAKLAAEEADNAKTMFMANMTHELRTPLTAIIGTTDILIGEGAGNMENDIRAIGDAGRNLLDMVNDVLDFTQLTHGSLPLSEGDYSPLALAQALEATTRTLVKDKDIRVMMFCDKLPPMLYGDRRRVRQIATNILSNAAKYTNTGEIRIDIGWKKRDEYGGTLLLKVRDTGIGIRSSELSKIFERFHRIEPERHRNIEGAGIGLSIVQELLRLMKGEISYDSIYGRGTTVVVEIPQLISRKESDMIPVDKEEPRAGINDIVENERKEEIIHHVSDKPPVRVLAVDDTEVNLKILTRLLAGVTLSDGRGLTFVTATSGRECLRLAMKENGRLDLIMLDHMMPEMDGIEVLSRLRTSGIQIPTLVMTATAGQNEMYLEKGFSAVITKPFMVDDTVHAIEHALSSTVVPVVDEDEEKDSGSDEKRIRFALDCESLCAQMENAVKSGNIAEYRQVVLSIKEKAAEFRLDALRSLSASQEHAGIKVVQVGWILVANEYRRVAALILAEKNK